MTASYISRTGRVQSWIDDPTSRLPVSCTVFVVEDSITGDNGIEASWKFVSHALRYGAGCAVHLSKLRPRGTENDKGLVASGPVSFAKIYSTLNEILRRGGVYKNGAIVCHLDLSHPDALEFMKTSLLKQGFIRVVINQQFINLNTDSFPSPLPSELSIVVDRLTLDQESRSRLVEALEAAFRESAGRAIEAHKCNRNLLGLN